MRALMTAALVAHVALALLVTATQEERPRPRHHRHATTHDCVPADGPQAPVRSCIDPPIRTRYVPPVYPAEPRRRGIGGIVILEVWIDSWGRVADTKLLQSAPAFDAAAVEAVRQWSYQRTCLDGRAMPVVMTVAVPFEPVVSSSRGVN